jgi:hypothetical protein
VRIFEDALADRLAAILPPGPLARRLGALMAQARSETTAAQVPVGGARPARVALRRARRAVTAILRQLHTAEAARMLSGAERATLLDAVRTLGWMLRSV